MNCREHIYATFSFAISGNLNVSALRDIPPASASWSLPERTQSISIRFPFPFQKDQTLKRLKLLFLFFTLFFCKRYPADLRVDTPFKAWEPAPSQTDSALRQGRVRDLTKGESLDLASLATTRRLWRISTSGFRLLAEISAGSEGWGWARGSAKFYFSNITREPFSTPNPDLHA